MQADEDDEGIDVDMDLDGDDDEPASGGNSLISSLLSQPEVNPLEYGNQASEQASDQAPMGDGSGAASLFVGGLFKETDENDVEEILESKGIQHSSINLVFDATTGKCKGHCFIEIHSMDAQKPVELLEGEEVLGSAIICEIA